MIIVTGIAEVAPQSVEQIKAAARVMAATTRTEAGCHAYAFYEDLEQPGRFRLYEEWETADHLRAHFATPHMAEFQAVIRSTEGISIQIKQFLRGDDIKVND